MHRLLDLIGIYRPKWITTLEFSSTSNSTDDDQMWPVYCVIDPHKEPPITHIITVIVVFFIVNVVDSR